MGVFIPEDTPSLYQAGNTTTLQIHYLVYATLLYLPSLHLYFVLSFNDRHFSEHAKKFGTLAIPKAADGYGPA